MTPARAYYPGFQALRGLGCLGVVVQHASGYAGMLAPGPTATITSLNLGGSGIMLFFALSAFLMLERSEDPIGRFTLDRLRRVFPLLWISLLVAGAASYYVHHATGLRWTTFLLIPTTVPAYVPVPFWSLSFELLFYLLVALGGLGGRNTVITVVLLWCAIGIAFHQSPYDPLNHALYPQIYPFFVTVFGYYFAAGILARIGFDPQSRLRWIYGLGAVGLYVTVQWHLLPSWVYAVVPVDRHGSLFFGLLAVGCFLAIRAAALWTPRSLPARMLGRIGDYSYGIYLMHMTCMMLLHRWLEALGLPLGFWTAMTIMVVVPLAVSSLWGELDLSMQRAIKRLTTRRSADRQWPDAPAAPQLAGGRSAPLA